MKYKTAHCISLIVFQFVFIAQVTANEGLPSWREGKTKQAIVDFVDKTTQQNSQHYIPPAARIAVFDNDGTLWAEQPVYFQLLFIFDRIKQLAPQHPEWRDQEPFASAIKGDVDAVMALGRKQLIMLMEVVMTGMTVDEFKAEVNSWISTAKHPQSGRLYTEMVYQPMLELLQYLRTNGYKTWIVSGGGVDFIRAWAEAVYGIPPEQVIGTRLKTRFEMQDGKPVLNRLPELDLMNDKEFKPVGIYQQIGRQPIMAFGNSDGDLAMLQWTALHQGSDGSAENQYPRFAAYLHHTDAKREWAYDRESSVGKLEEGLNEAVKHQWLVIDMAKDWLWVFPAVGSH